jgi:glycosyltransferase family protein
MENISESYEQCARKIEYLEEKNEYLTSELAELNSRYNELSQTVLKLVKTLSQVSDRSNNNAMLLYNRVRNLPYEVLDYRFEGKYDIPKLMTIEQTIDEIVLNNKSIARFGDGEFGIMFGISYWRFQKTDAKLAERLREVVTSNDDRILIGINDFYGDLSHRTPQEAEGIRSYITPEIRAQHMELLRLDKLYGNALITWSPTMERVKNQKRIWDGKDCVFIEGDKTRMGVGNDLFDNAKSIQRILCPAESAFDNYDAILEEAKKIPKDKTILIALGPTASVLAYDLARLGYHAIDIGHVDLAYEWLLRNGGQKIIVSNKYSNECPEGYIVEDIHDEVYDSQIIADLSK